MKSLAFIIICFSLPFFYLAHICDQELNTPYKLSIKGIDTHHIPAFTAYFNDHWSKTGKAPTPHEARNWMSSKDREGYRFEGRGYGYTYFPFKNEVIKVFGPGPANGFTLTYWNGDVYITYASWQKDKSQGTIITAYNNDMNTIPRMFRLISLIFGLGLVAGAFFTLKKNPQAQN